jgi:hypothetical protein
MVSRGTADLLPGWRVWALLGWAIVVVGGALSYWLDGQKAMPYVGQFVTPTGIGPEDLIAARPLLMQPFERVALTAACGAASIVAAGVLLRWRCIGCATAVVPPAAVTTARPVAANGGTVTVESLTSAGSVTPSRAPAGAHTAAMAVPAATTDAAARAAEPRPCAAVAPGRGQAMRSPVAATANRLLAANGAAMASEVMTSAGRVAANGAATAAVVVVAAVAVGQVVGTIPPSVHFISWGGTLDRYLLPLLPFCVVLLLAAWPGASAELPRASAVWPDASASAVLPSPSTNLVVRGARTSLWLASAAVFVMGVWSVAGTRDHLAFLDGVWSLAYEANALGIDNLRLDAGSGWDGFRDYAAPPDLAVPPRTPDPPWWAELFAPRMDSSYVIAGQALPGYTVVTQGGYVSWLRHEWMPLYLLRRPDVAGPP